MRVGVGMKVGVALATALLGLAMPSPATAASGPPLTVPKATMDAALMCTGNLRTGAAPILFLHGTTSTSKANWSWNWNKAMKAAGRSYCNLDTPAGATGDIQIAGEYVVNAIRTMNSRAGRKISIVGHSQGGMVGRWALKYWPDTRAMVDDYVGLASSNHGATGARGLCALPIGCPAANWQQSSESNFLAALNDGPETWPGVSYTEIATKYDEIATPPSTAFLTPGRKVTNTYVQDLCPLELVEHFGMAYDNAAWLIGIDALTHTGPAVISRVPRTTCGQITMPAVNLATFAADAAAAMLVTVTNSATAKNLTKEPALRRYAQ